VTTNVQKITKDYSEEQSGDSPWFSRSWLEPRFVVLTVLAIAASYGGRELNAGRWFDSILALVAYAAGDAFGAKPARPALPA
jgi:hypothetical protein